MKIKNIFKYFLYTYILFIILFLFSCSTLPAPESSDEVLLVILTKITGKTEFDFGGYRIHLEGSDIEPTIVAFPSRRGYKYVPIKPGYYIVTKIELTGGEELEVIDEMNMEIEFKAGQIKIFPFSFNAYLSKTEEKVTTSRGWYTRIWHHKEIRLELLTDEEKEEIIEDLKKEENFIYWKISTD